MPRSVPLSRVGEECWMTLRLEVGTFQSASNVVSLNNDLKLKEPVNADADRGSIDYGFEDSPDCHTKSIVEELTRIIRLFGSARPEKLANSAVEGFGDSE